MAAAVGPHTRSRRQPDTCPVCGKPYQYRLPRRLDDYPVGGAYRHGHRQHVYVHEIDRTQVNEYRWGAPTTGGDTA